MKVSRTWLQKFFETPLPDAEGISDALTFHSSEVEEIQGDMLDVKVLPDRACYALSHRGIASELSAALDVPRRDDPFGQPIPEYPATNELSVSVCDDQLIPRYMGALVRGVKVGPSPAWLKEAIESVGQRSINNVVDATNYVMLNVGQPLHAFDAAKLTNKEGYAVGVRKAYEGEKITTLTGEEYLVPEDTLLIVDGHADAPLGIAGIKGGRLAEVNEKTTDLIIESANFDGTQVRRAAQALKLFTEASTRFQNRPSPELAAYGMRDVLALITEIAGGEVIGVVDQYSTPQESITLDISLERLNGVLGTAYSGADVTGALNRLGLAHTVAGDVFHITPPLVRRDLQIPEDMAEEVGRILGYEHVPPTQLPSLAEESDQRQQRGIERIKDVLLERGYVEISTPSFTEGGEILLANPLQMDRPYLRPDLSGNMRDALTRAKREAPRTLGPEPWVKLFEIGTAFLNKGEQVSLVLGYDALTGKASKTILDEDIDALTELGLPKVSHDGSIAEVSLADVALEKTGEGYEPKRLILGSYRPYSLYPFALRDIAVWTPEGTEESEVAMYIQKEAGELLLRMDLFDTFSKEGRTSYAFRLVFEASDRTLSDADLDPVMERITAALNAKEGWEVR